LLLAWLASGWRVAEVEMDVNRDHLPQVWTLNACSTQLGLINVVSGESVVSLSF
jgi:hypothetical protein